MVSIEIIRVGYKIYIITKTDKETSVVTVGEGSKIEKRKFKHILEMPFNEYFKIILAKVIKNRFK